MSGRGVLVELPADEFLARPLIVVWLGYPENARQRSRKLHFIQQWARNRIGQNLIGRSDPTERDKIEGGLSQLSRMVDRQLLAGEIFRQQIIGEMPYEPGTFSSSSATNFARRLAEYRQGIDATGDYGNEHRTYWRARRGCLALAVGVCEGRSKRPTIEDLLFTDQAWALRAIQEGIRIRAIAISQQHHEAHELIDFKLTKAP